jgi:hypothetical protein
MRALPRARRLISGALVTVVAVGGVAATGACDTFDTAPAADGGGAVDGGTPALDGGGADGAGPTRDGGDAGPAYEPCDGGTRVFVTSGTYPANFGTAAVDPKAAADALCTAAAASAGLARPYHAWLASGAVTIGRRAELTKPSGAFVSTDCRVVFAETPDDFRTTLKNPIDRIETGAAIESLGNAGAVHTVWTGAVADGTSTGANCGDWKLTGGPDPTTGDLKQTGANWTTGAGGTCMSAGRFYCLEIPPP